MTYTRLESIRKEVTPYLAKNAKCGKGDALPREERKVWIEVTPYLAKSAKVWIYKVASTYTLYQVLNGEDVAGFRSLNLADLGYVMDK